MNGRYAILGNAGSGKSTLARWLAGRAQLALLDLDTVAWEPGRIAVARDPARARADVRAHCAAHDRWIVEGCYASLVGVALEHEPLLVFLDPGAGQCLAHCRARPHEPHKYASHAEQQERLPALLEWVRDYYVRDGDMSRAAHAACYDAYRGPKCTHTAPLALSPPGAQALRLLG